MPKTTPYVKVRRTEALGARVLLRGNDLAEAAAAAGELAAEQHPRRFIRTTIPT